MPDQGRGGGEGERSRADGPERRDESVGWHHIYGTGHPPADAHETDDGCGTDPPGAGDVPHKQTDILGAFSRATEVFAGPAGPVLDRIDTFVAELPQWFRHPDTTEVRVELGDDVVTTDDFTRTADPLTAAARTRVGTQVSLTVVSTDQRSDADETRWLGTEQELVETLVSLITNHVEQWEIDSLKRVSDGVAMLDSDLRYTYVNSQAEQILGEPSDQLRGEHVWDVFPEAVGTVAQERIETALETQTPASYERYNADKEQWVEARVYPTDDGIVLLFTDITASKTTERTIEQVLETAPIGLVVLTAEGEITRANPRAEELLGRSRNELEGTQYDRLDWELWSVDGTSILPEHHPVAHVMETGEPVQEFIYGITLPDGSTRWLSSSAAPVRDAADRIEHVVVALRDITGLKRLERLVETTQAVHTILNRASTREDTERAVCDQLTDSSEYDAAWISDYTPGSASLTPRVRSGSDSSLGALEVPLGDAESADGLTRTAIESGEIQVIEGHDDRRAESRRTHGLAHGFRATAIVPLTHNDRTHGVLGLYTDRVGAFDERERTLLGILGDRIGQVLHALDTERLLHADSVVELTFESTDPGSFFVHASARLGCTIDIVDTIPSSDETIVYYASVEGAPVDAIVDVAGNASRAVRARPIGRREEPVGGEIELKLSQQTLAYSLMTMGAVVTRDTVCDGRAEVVCEVSPDEDINSLVTRLTDSFPETTLVAKREFNRTAESGAQSAERALADAFRADLTDRQRQVIRAAVSSGYFHSPRQSTATEIADALSLTQSTFSYHLRNAQRTLFERMFERL